MAQSDSEMMECINAANTDNSNYLTDVSRKIKNPYSRAFWSLSADNKTRTCTILTTDTWNQRVYQFRHIRMCFTILNNKHQNVQKKNS